MSGKQVDQWSGDEDYDYDSDDYSYDSPSQGYEIQPRSGYGVVFREDKQASSYEQSWRCHDRDKKTGNYKTASTKEVASRGETFKERSTGRVGYKDEFKTTSTYRVGDRSGYTEYQCQERYRRVDYGSSGSGSKGGHSNYSSSKKYLK